MFDCHIQDKGVNILYQRLQHTNDIMINQLWLTSNGLTTQSSSMISEITVQCEVKNLGISSNYTIGENQQLYSMLSNPTNVLEQLYMSYTHLSSTAAIYLFTALKDNHKLKVLHIDHNDITDIACPAITTTMVRNSCLVILNIYENPLSTEAILSIIQSLVINNYTLQILNLPECP